MSKDVVASPWFHIPEAARYARMSDWRMSVLVKSGAIPSHKDPGQVNGTLVYAGDIDDYLMSLPSGASGRPPTPPS